MVGYLAALLAAAVGSEGATVCFCTFGTAVRMALRATRGPVADTSKSRVGRARGSMRQQAAAILTRPRAHPQEVGQPGRHRRVLADERFRGLREEGRNWRALHGLCMLRWRVRWWVRCGAVRPGTHLAVEELRSWTRQGLHLDRLWHLGSLLRWLGWFGRGNDAPSSQQVSQPCGHGEQYEGFDVTSSAKIAKNGNLGASQARPA